KTGAINKSDVDHWKKYDLRMLLEQNWMTLGPKVRGKIHISVGEADDYYLNNAVHLLDDFFKKADPPADARISYGPDRGHCWNSLSEPQMMNEMAIAVEQSNPHLPRRQEQQSGTAARLRGLSVVGPSLASVYSVVPARCFGLHTLMPLALWDKRCSAVTSDWYAAVAGSA